MKMNFERVLVKGKKKYKLYSVEGILKKSELPEDYLEGEKHFYLRTIGGANLCFSSWIKLFSIEVGETLSEETYERLIHSVPLCCAELKRINKKIKASNHFGTFTLEC